MNQWSNQIFSSCPSFLFLKIWPGPIPSLGSPCLVSKMDWDPRLWCPLVPNSLLKTISGPQCWSSLCCLSKVWAGEGTQWSIAIASAFHTWALWLPGLQRKKKTLWNDACFCSAGKPFPTLWAFLRPLKKETVSLPSGEKREDIE